MDSNPVSLKSSMFGGFKKREVLSYIFELNESTQESQQKFAEQIEELSNSREALARSVGELEARLAAMQADLDNATSKLDAETAKYAEAEGIIEKLNAEAAKHRQDISEKDDEIRRFASMNSELAEKNRQHEEKRAQVELAASQIAKLLNEAEDDAVRIVEEANGKVAQILDEAKLQADGVVAAAKESASAHIFEANKAVNDIYSKFKGFCGELGGMHKTIADATFDINSKMETLKDMAVKVGEALPEGLELNDADLLSYDVEDDAGSGGPVKDRSSGVGGFAKEILGRYGVRKDDSGFFRLAAERTAPKP